MIQFIVSVIVGAILIVFSKPIGSEWKRYQEHFTDTDLELKSQINKVIIAGAIFIVIGIILLVVEKR